MVVERHGPWRILSSRKVYSDPWIEVQRDQVVRPDGADGTHCVVRMKPGVSVLPLDEDGSIYLTEEFHYGIGRVTIEAVSGGIEPGEIALATARRELKEELGITAARWTELGMIDPFTTIVVSPTALFLAQGLSFGPTAREGTEKINAVRVPLAQAMHWVMQTRITHGPSCVLILKAHSLLGLPTITV